MKNLKELEELTFPIPKSSLKQVTKRFMNKKGKRKEERKIQRVIHTHVKTTV